MARHYVYRYALETESGEVIDLYVGHGTGNRAVVHLDRSHNPRLRGMIDWALAEGLGAGCRLVVGILGTHRTRAGARAHEHVLVEGIGRCDLTDGPLFNRRRAVGNRGRRKRAVSMSADAVRKREQRLRKRLGLPSRPRGRPRIRRREWEAAGCIDVVSTTRRLFLLRG
jgi:hypothetical protein